MAVMMVLMVVFLAAVPGGHMGLLDSHHSTEASQSGQHDGAKPKPEAAPQSQGHDAAMPNQEKP